MGEAEYQLNLILNGGEASLEQRLKAAEILAQLEQSNRQQDFWESQNQQPCTDCPPKVGDIVLYNHPGDATGTYPRKQSPAMILQVHEDGSCDLHVFTAPTWGPHGALGGGGEYINFRAAEGTDPFNWTRR